MLPVLAHHALTEKSGIKLKRPVFVPLTFLISTDQPAFRSVLKTSLFGTERNAWLAQRELSTMLLINRAIRAHTD